jgi:hypothetical protein
MEITEKHKARMAAITFAAVYPHYVTKVERKGRTKEELHEVITWLTGFTPSRIKEQVEAGVTLEVFFNQAKLNPNADRITGTICGYRIEAIDDALTKKVRYLDKLVDELAKGRPMHKILREG